MLTITLTPGTLVFKEMPDDLMEHLASKYDFEFKYDSKEHPIVKGKPEELFKLLYLLSCDYDIELT